MSWTRVAATVSAAVLAGWAVCASAADDEYGRSGPYFGVGATYAFENFSGDANDRSVDDSWGYNIRGGYRFNEYFALEIDWDHFVGFDGDGFEGFGGDADIWMIGASGKLYPFSGIIQPYLSAGAGWCGIDDSRALDANHMDGYDNTGFAARFAAGLDVYVGRNWALFAEAGYFLPTGGRVGEYDAIPISFGVFYRFF